MKRQILMLTVAALCALILMSGCSRNKSLAQDTSPHPYAPVWWNTQPSYLHINSYGIGTGLSIIASRDAAKADALLKMSPAVQTYVNDMMKKFVREAALTDSLSLQKSRLVSAATANARFSNILSSNIETMVVSQSGDEVFKSFVQLMIPKFEINRSLLEQVRNDFEFYDVLRASDSFQTWEKLLMNR